jgi:transposase
MDALPAGRKLRVMFEDEGRFGCCGQTRRAWSAPGARPVCRTRLERAYTYAFTAVDPLRGAVESLVVPRADMETTGLFLAQLGRRFRRETVLLLLDRASWHTGGRLVVPKNIRLDFLPSYSPQLNPVEHVWDEVRRDFFSNRLLPCLDAVESTLCAALKELHKNPKRVRSFAGFDWIITSLMNAN